MTILIIAINIAAILISTGIITAGNFKGQTSWFDFNPGPRARSGARSASCYTSGAVQMQLCVCLCVCVCFGC